MDLSGRIAIVTGGSRGIGRQMAEALGEMGAKLAITARKDAELDEARAHLAGAGVDCMTVAGDLSDPAAVVSLVDSVIAKWGRVDILVNNAGCNWGAPAEDYPNDAWYKVMRLNIDAAFFLSREVAKRSMIDRRSGRIINIASIAGLGGYPPEWQMYTAAYNTSKGALIALTRTLAAEWGRHNINVNAICPGFFLSKMTAASLDRIEQSVLSATPLGRLGGVEDLMGCVAFLASDASRHVTGQALAVDGGLSVI
jgi:gluconate 5-dehydrogenase